MSVNIVHSDGSLEKIAGMGFGEPGPQGPQGPQGPAGEAADYEGLSNQPRINSVRLTGNKSSVDLGLQPNMSTAAQLSFGALASLTAYLNSNRKIPNNSTVHINDYDTDYVVSARAAGDTEDSCIFISDTQKITPYYQLGRLDIRAFGAGHANTAENSAKIVKAIKYAQSAGIKLYVPQGRWYLKESIPLSGLTIIEGATSAGNRGLYFASCSMLFFDPEQSNISMFTESGSHSLSIRHITLICGKIVNNEAQLYTTYTGNYTTQVAEIPHNYMTWTYSYENVNCLNCYDDSNPVSKNSWLDLLDVNIVGFSGYGVKCGNALTLNSVRFAKCKYGFYNVLTDNQFYETFIQACEYGFYWDAGGPLIMLYDTWIDQCKYGLFSTMGLGGLFQGGEIDHCLYAGMCCLGSCDMKVEARFGRLGMYYLGEDMLAKAKLIDTYTEESFLDMSKGVDIAIRWGNKFNFDLSEEPKNISDNGTTTSKLPTLLVFGQTLRGIIKTAHDFADRAYYAIQNACVTTIDAYNLTDIAELPSPAAYRLDKLFLLTESQTGYVKGGIYKCVAKGTDPETYEWELLNEPTGGGSSSLSGLTDTTITNPQSGDVLVYDGEKWKNGNSATDNIDVSTGLTRIFDINHVVNPFAPSTTYIKIIDGVMTVNAPASGNIFPNYYIQDSDIVDHHGICKIRLHVASVGGTWRVQFRIGMTGGGTANIRMLDITEPGTYDLVLRLDELTVYHQYDGNGVNVALININHDVSIVVDEFDTFVGIATNLAGSKLTENLMNTNARVERLENNNSVVLSSPSGDKFMLQLDNNNSIKLIPIIPNNVLYVGNSLLLGFTTHGMASYDTTDDYYALINDYLTDKGVTLTTDRLACSMFETAESDTTVNNFLNTLLLPKLSNDTQLVIIQAGDNTTTALAREKFKTSCATLIEFIFTHAPNARIAWAGTWYENDTVNEVITNTCKQYSITRIPLNDLSIVDGNMSHIGATYIDANGDEQTITTAGVASHPSPQGMRAIADRIISTLFE